MKLYLDCANRFEQREEVIFDKRTRLELCEVVSYGVVGNANLALPFEASTNSFVMSFTPLYPVQEACRAS